MKDKLYNNTIDNTVYKHLSCRFYIYTLLFLLVNCLLCHYGCVGFCDYCGGSRNSGSSVRCSEKNNDIKIEVYKKANQVTITCPNGTLDLSKITDGKLDGNQIVNDTFVNSGSDVYYSQVDNEDTYGVFIDYLISKNGEAISMESGFWRLLFLGEQMKENNTYLFALVTVDNVQYLVYCEDAKSVEVENPVLLGTEFSYYGLFQGSSATEIEILSCGSDITNMSKMFSECTSLTSIKFSDNFNTSNVKDMSLMFYDCSSLQNLDLSSFKTSNVTDIRSMFSECKILNSLNLSNFDTSNVKDMNCMFYNCTSLDNITFSNNFKTNKVTNMSDMFYYCSSLQKLDLSNFDTSKVTNMSFMFYNCSSLPELNLENFNTSNVKDMSNMFYGCSRLQNLDLSKLKTSNVILMSNMFEKCSGLQSLDLSNFTTNEVTNMSYMFCGCSNLKNINFSDNFNINNVIDMSYMFYNCSSLTGLNLSNFNTGNVENMDSMFSECSKLTELDLSKFNTDNVENMQFMFCNCSSLQKLDLSNFNTINVKYSDDMFSLCFKDDENNNANNTLICPGKAINNITDSIRHSNLKKEIDIVNIDDETLYECTVVRNDGKSDVTIIKAEKK